MSRSRRESVLLGTAAVLVVVIALLAGALGDDPSLLDGRVSTYHDTPSGARALSLVLQASGVTVERRRAPLEADSIEGPLAVLAPTEDLTPGEIRRLRAWVRAGGTLHYAARVEDPLLDSLGLALVGLDGRDLDERQRYAPRRAATPAAPHPWTAGIGSVDHVRLGFHPTAPRLEADGWTPLMSSGGFPVVVLLEEGKGRVVAWADPFPLTNGALASSDAAVLFVRSAAATAGPGGTMWFDEYHHGYGADGNVVTWAARFVRERPLGRALLQCAGVAVLLLLLGARRFGAPLPPPPARRRSPLEHVEALSGAYLRGGARHTARRLLTLGLARRLGRRAPPDEPAERELVESLARGLPVGAAAAAAVEAEWKKGDGADLVALARDMDRLIDEVKQT